MPLKHIDELAPGDVAATDVPNSQGLVLVRAGNQLTETHIRLCRMWGIETLRVDDDDHGAEDAELEGQLDRAEADAKARFGPSLDNEIMAEILRVAVEQLAARVSAEEVGRHE